MTDLADSTLLEALRSDPFMTAQITHIQTLEAKEGKFQKPTARMNEKLSDHLSQLGYGRLFTHQAQAYDAAANGDDIFVVTGTNSGKTLCYNLPVIQKCLSEPACRALYLFPTKALAQDQLSKLSMLLPDPSIRCGVYDGDTPKSQRAAIRQNAHIVLSNPDMLHTAILPSHELWSRFLKSLRVVVLDELHTYRGVFGSHVAGIIRRLFRLCEWRHNRPLIIACSATIGNPKELFRKLTSRECRLISEDGSPNGRRTFVFWNPPMLADQTRVSANVVTSEILATLCESNLRSIAFCRARVTAELVLKYTRERLAKKALVKPSRVESYRAGYTPKERRQIERGIFKGDILSLAATNAMELGVDIGGLDAVVMNGYPGTLSSFWQQSGRAGRGTHDGYAIFVARDDPLEQFLVHEPHRLMEAGSDNVALNPLNEQILSQQLRCAAFERPLNPSEFETFGGEAALSAAEALDRAGELHFQSGAFCYPSFESPAMKVNIRGGGGETVNLICNGEVLGDMEQWRAMQSAHEGAVYLHRGVSYLVSRLDLDKGLAELVLKETNYYTQAIVQSSLEVQMDAGAKSWGRLDARLVGIQVTDIVSGYKEVELEAQRVLSVCPLAMPPVSYETLGVRLDLPLAEDAEDSMNQAAALHALEHALIAVAPLLAGCDRGDLGSAWYNVFPGTFRPALFVFDRTPGGVGLTEALFQSLRPWASAASQMLSACPCEDGCPACLLSARCEAGNELLDKAGAMRLLGLLLA